MAGHILQLKKIPCVLIITSLTWFLVSCASSNVSRDSASNVDIGLQNLYNMSGNASETLIGDAYQNSSQSVKGGIIGGTIGAIAGSVSTLGFVPATAAGAILGASYGAYVDTNTTLRDKLENRGIGVVIIGDQVLINIPSARIFEALSNNIKTQSYGTMELIAQFINRYNKELIKISAYTTQTNSSIADKALSESQAIAVEKMLILSGVDGRILYAQGYGAASLVAQNDMSWYGNDNYRVTITFQKLYA